MRIMWCNRIVPAGLCGLLALGCAPGPDDGLEKYPVVGHVMVNGEPAAMMAVTFHNQDPSAPGNAARPVAVTDDRGRFELSTNGDRDGAVSGEYVVTFLWPSENGPSAYDRLGGLLADVGRSEHRVTIDPEATELEPFLLEVDPKRIRPPAAGPALFE